MSFDRVTIASIHSTADLRKVKYLMSFRENWEEIGGSLMLTLFRIINRCHINELFNTIQHFHIGVIVIANPFDMLPLRLRRRLLSLEYLAARLN